MGVRQDRAEKLVEGEERTPMGAGVAIAEGNIALIRFTGVGGIASDSKEKSGRVRCPPNIPYQG
jgi:hypothetical protein